MVVVHLLPFLQGQRDTMYILYTVIREDTMGVGRVLITSVVFSAANIIILQNIVKGSLQTQSMKTQTSHQHINFYFTC